MLDGERLRMCAEQVRRCRRWCGGWRAGVGGGGEVRVVLIAGASGGVSERLRLGVNKSSGGVRSAKSRPVKR